MLGDNGTVETVPAAADLENAAAPEVCFAAAAGCRPGDLSASILLLMVSQALRFGIIIEWASARVPPTPQSGNVSKC